MKINKTFVLIILILLGMGYLIYYGYHYFGHKDNILTQETGIQLWTCPMHPQIIRDQPGKCPICHMDLVPLENQTKNKNEENQMQEDHSQHKQSNISEIQIKIEPSIIQKIGLKVEKIEKKQVERTIQLVGHIEYDEAKIYIINSRINGWIEKLYVKTEGTYVRSGQPLLSIYSPELVSTQEEYLNLYKQYISAKNTLGEQDSTVKELYKTLISSRERLKYWNISDFQIKQIEKNLKTNHLLSLFSPYDGFVIEKKVFEGQKISEGMDLFKIANISNVWVVLHIPEKEVPFIYVGQKVKIQIPQLSGKNYYGKISYIYPYIAQDTRDFKARIDIKNSNFELKPGMYANVELIYKVPKEILIVPYSSVVKTGKRNIVFVYKGEGIVEPREVEIGLTDGENWIEIIQGIKEEESVVTSGQFLLDSETRIQEAIQKLKNPIPVHTH